LIVGLACVDILWIPSDIRQIKWVSIIRYMGVYFWINRPSNWLAD